MSNETNKEEDGDIVFYDLPSQESEKESTGSEQPQEPKKRHRHEHHHRQHKRGWKGRLMRVLAILCIVLVCLVVAALITWRVADALGRANLYSASESTGPDLAAAADTTETTESENWESGWIRYNGKVMEYNEDILTFLFMGIDKNGPAVAGANGIDGGQADGIFLLVMNPDTKEIDIVAINRNTMTEIDVYDEDGNYVGSGLGQICLQHGYGDGLEQSCERTVKAVENLFYGLPIHGYCSIGIDAVGALADAVGGVTVPRMSYVDGEITYGDDETLYGSDAIYYVQHRDMDEYDSASFRLEKQKYFLQDFMTKLKTMIQQDPTSILTLYNAIADYVVTDVSTTEMVYLADQIGGYTLNTDIYSMTGTTTHAEDAKTGHEEFVYDEDALYDMIISVFYCEVDPDTGEVISYDGSVASTSSTESSTESTEESSTESTEAAGTEDTGTDTEESAAASSE